MLPRITHLLSLDSYMAQINHLFSPNYLLSDKDVLHSRLRTTGIMELVFKLGKGDVHVFDVGGFRSERKKWVHTFEGCHSMLFVASVAGYDECLGEDMTGVCSILLTYAPISAIDLDKHALTSRLPESDARGTVFIRISTVSSLVQKFRHYLTLNQTGSLRREN